MQSKTRIMNFANNLLMQLKKINNP